MDNTIRALIVSSTLIMAVLVTGCVQDNGGLAGNSTVSPPSPGETRTPTPVSPADQVMMNASPPAGIPESTYGVVPPVGGGNSPQNAPQGMPQAGERHHPVMNATVLAEAAAKLGVTQQQMEEAMNVTAGGPPDLSAAAENLGVTREELIEALSFPRDGHVPQGDRNSTMYPHPPETRS